MTDIRKLRQEKKLKLKELAEAISVSQTQLSKWERGLGVPSENDYANIAKALDADLVELMNGHSKYLSNPSVGEGYVTSAPTDFFINKRQRDVPPNKLKVLDLFCGAGGFSYGIEMTGNFVVTGGIDLLPDRVTTFSNNHPYATAVCGDMRSIKLDKLKELASNPDVIVAGPPCQGFSSIRPFRGLTEDDPRNSLLEYFVLAVSTMKPKWCVFENVVGLLTHKSGEVLNSLLAALEGAGYQADWRVVNCAQYGIPQYRERIIVVASRDGETFPWPTPTHKSYGRTMAGKSAKRIVSEPLLSGLLPEPVTVEEAIADLPQIEAGEKAIEYSLEKKLTSYQREMRANAPTNLSLHDATKHSDKMMEIIRLSGSNRNALPEGLTTSGFSSCYSRLEPNEPSVTITVNFVHPSSNKCIHPTQNRALTPREGARLQSFPDRFIFNGSRAQIVKQIGNAVPPLLGKAIGESLSTIMLNASVQRPEKRSA